MFILCSLFGMLVNLHVLKNDEQIDINGIKYTFFDTTQGIQSNLGLKV